MRQAGTNAGPLMAAGVALALTESGVADPSDFIIERVARTGDPVPGIEGAVWGDIGSSLIDGQGNVLIQGNYFIGESLYFAYFHGSPGNLTAFMEWGTPAPGFDDSDMLLAFPGDPNLAESGDVATCHYVGDPEEYWNATPSLYSGRAGSLSLILYDGGPAPDAPEGTSVYLSYEPYTNASGRLAHIATLHDFLTPGDYIDAIIAGDPSDLRLVARIGDQAPGMAEGVYFVNFLFEAISLDANGNVAFIAYVDGPEINETNNIGLWAGPRDAPILVPQLRTGEQAPGTETGTVFAGLPGAALNNRAELIVSRMAFAPPA
jgi:hypothetical protein